MSRYDLCTMILQALSLEKMRGTELARLISAEPDHVYEMLRKLESEGIVSQCPQTRYYRIAEINDCGWSLA